MAEFTPGPWEAAEFNGDGSFAIWAAAAHPRVICRRGAVAQLAETSEANAHLIAAAPDLLEAAAALTAKYKAPDFPMYMRAEWEALEDAIAKARGDQ